jgi:hypothetical protein
MINTFFENIRSLEFQMKDEFKHVEEVTDIKLLIIEGNI